MTASRERRGDPYAGMPGRRLFVAVPLPGDAAEAVRSIVDEVRAEALPDGARDVRWVRLDGLHLTLRFLGPTADERIEPTAAAVRAVASAAPGPIETRAWWRRDIPTARSASSALDRGRRGHRGARTAIGQSSMKRWSPRAGSPIIDRSGHTSPSLDRTGSRPVRSSPDRLSAAMAGRRIEARLDVLGLFESVTGGGPARYVPVTSVPFGATADEAEAVYHQPIPGAH